MKCSICNDTKYISRKDNSEKSSSFVVRNSEMSTSFVVCECTGLTPENLKLLREQIKNNGCEMVSEIKNEE